ncbi:MFS transporter [Singulisphaera sp. PoT]|uniref:MFS transporter n=1 Tax=Singulisphaera sp. PoT TaxID=3411797 RepID=UPI003BF4A7DB
MNESARLRRRQVLTVALVVAGYSGYYLCRSNLSVAIPEIIKELAARGWDPGRAKEALGAIVSMGILAYAIGKPFAGALADFLGGRFNYFGGMLGAILMTALFAMGGGMPIFATAWFGNRLLQSFGWGGIIKITSRWFGFSTYGTVMGVISLSYLFGDAAARGFMGLLFARGLSWRAVFMVDAAVLLLFFAINAWLLVEDPTHLGFKEPDVNPDNVYGEGGQDAVPANLRSLLGPLLRRPAFWIVCLLSVGLTFLREAFNNWTPTYFVDSVGLSQAQATSASALFPLVGGVSVILSGYLSDKLGRGGRSTIILVGLCLAGSVLTTLGVVNFAGSTRWPIILVTSVAFFLLGPYSYLAGAVSLDLGGKQGGATASGLIDLAGYFGSIVAGWGIARASIIFGWRGVFLILAGIAWVSSVVAAIYYWEQHRRPASGDVVEVNA